MLKLQSSENSTASARRCAALEMENVDTCCHHLAFTANADGRTQTRDDMQVARAIVRNLLGKGLDEEVEDRRIPQTLLR